MTPAQKTPSKTSASPKALRSVGRQQLLLLNGLLDEVARNYIARLHREIAGLVRTLEKKQPVEKYSHRQVKDLRAILERIAHLQINPERGRRKDLKKIDALIGDLQTSIESW